MTQETIQTVVRSYGYYQLKEVQETLTRELEAAMQAGERGTQAHAGKLEMLAAIGKELSHRNPPVPWVEVSREDGIRHVTTVRVF